MRNTCSHQFKTLLFRQLLFLILLLPLTSIAQGSKEETPIDTLSLDLDEKVEDEPSILLNPGQVEEVVRKKRKKKRNEYWELKTKKQFTRVEKRNRQEFELFNILKKYEDPPKYVPQKYYFDLEERNIKIARTSSPTNGMPLHGPYTKIVNEDTVVTGYFYKGVKTGRWTSYSSDMLLKDKKYYYMGFPKEAIISYYDPQQSKIKEVIPIQYGIKEGTYLLFYENGRLKETGLYKEDTKVGQWIQYYDLMDPRGRQRRKEIKQYRNKNKPFDNSFNPYVKYKFDEKGKTVYKHGG